MQWIKVVLLLKENQEERERPMMEQVKDASGEEGNSP